MLSCKLRFKLKKFTQILLLQYFFLHRKKDTQINVWKQILLENSSKKNICVDKQTKNTLINQHNEPSKTSLYFTDFFFFFCSILKTHSTEIDVILTQLLNSLKIWLIQLLKFTHFIMIAWEKKKLFLIKISCFSGYWKI